MATSRSAPSSTAGALREDEHPAGEADELLAGGSTLVDGHEHDNDDDNDAQDSTHRPLRASVEQEFARAPPAWWKRLALLAGIVLAGWISIKLGQSGKRDVIYAQRYSDEFRYRPAGSPIITETLKDGRLRIRGAALGGQGVRETDMPKTPLQIEHEQKLRREEAAQAAKDKLREARERARKRGRERREKRDRARERG